MLSRRRLLIGGGAAVAASLAGTHHWRRFRRPSFADIAQLISERLAHLDLDPAGVERFAREYDARFGSFAMSVHHRKTWGGLLRYRAILDHLPPLEQQAVLEPERRLIGYYLRSTNYFDPARVGPVRFVALPDPYEGACSNPFAVLGL